jgi:Hint domain
MRTSDRPPPPASLARRHFMAIAAAGAARLSTIAASSLLLAGKSADAMGTWGPDDLHHDRDHDDHDHDDYDHDDYDHGDNDRGGHNHHCFGRGTLILTAHGEVPIEKLAIGELVMTTNGAMPVRWIGRRTLRRNASGSWHPSVMPIRVARAALDDQTPRRDFYLSQGHSLFIDGFLIPVKHLVNERSITVDHDVKKSETIEYFCVELDSHQVIFAEGTAAETFQYDGGQISWDNLRDYQDLYGREHKLMPTFAPHCRYAGGRAEMRALLRLAASRFVDLRDPAQLAYARIATRAMSLAA